jgi:hypothetical protein
VSVGADERDSHRWFADLARCRTIVAIGTLERSTVIVTGNSAANAYCLPVTFSMERPGLFPSLRPLD